MKKKYKQLEKLDHFYYFQTCKIYATYIYGGPSIRPTVLKL